MMEVVVVVVVMVVVVVEEEVGKRNLIILARSVDEAAGHEELVRSSRSSRLTCRRR